MNKTDLLLRMMEQPQEFSEQQWQEMLADEECRGLYTLMSNLQSVYDLQHEVSDEEIADEWQRLCLQGGKTEFSHAKAKKTYSIIHSPFRKVAAMLVAVLMLSGIAIAAMQMVRLHQNQETALTANAMAVVSTAKEQQQARTTLLPKVVFDNVTLDKMVEQIADRYHLVIEIQNEQARELRFYFVWWQQDSLQTVIEQLNQFERVNVVVDREKLIVR